MDMLRSPLVSVIVPIYKTEKYLEQCVKSLLYQTYQNIEILLIDDGSPDECPVLCDLFATIDRRVRVIHKENGGLSSARKTGIRNVTGEYVLIVDSDDWIDPDTISRCVETALQDNADCVMFSYVREYSGKSIDTLLFDSDFSYDVSQAEEKIHRRIVGAKGEELREPHRIDSFSSVCMKLYRTEIAKKGRIVSERVVGTSEDTIFNLFALENCRISYVNCCFYHYRKNNEQSITARYKPDLVEKWDVMYNIIQEYIRGSGKEKIYHIPFLNRVACGMIGLGLNEIGSNEGFLKKSSRLKRILKKPLYIEAFKQFDFSYCGLKWKLFFGLCKIKATLLLMVMLHIINFLRSRVAA